jgi:hypothetical protein
MSDRKSDNKNHLMRSSWNLGQTETMRVPKVLKARLMEIARYLDDGGTIELNNDLKTEFILSQDNLREIINILRHGITSKNQGGVYNSSNSSPLKKEVMKVLVILERENAQILFERTKNLNC